MTKLILFVVSIFVAVSSYAQAQDPSLRIINYNDAFSGPANWKETYSHFRGIDEVTTVYVSEAMFRLARRIPEINVDAIGDEDLNLAPIIKSLKSMYLINIPSECHVKVSDTKGSTFKVNRLIDLRDVLERFFTTNSSVSKLEPYLEVNHGKEQIRINASTVGDVITTFAMFVNQGDEATLVFIEGEIPQKELEDALGKVMQ